MTINTVITDMDAIGARSKYGCKTRRKQFHD